jgi:predicted nucleic acid-binding protein
LSSPTRHPHVLLDTSVVIDYPGDLVAQHAESASITTISLAELAFGLHTSDPLVNAAREQRYHWISATFDPISFQADSARTYGALCALVRAARRDPKPRRFDLLIAAVAVARALPLLTRNAADFQGLHRALNVIPITTTGIDPAPTVK